MSQRTPNDLTSLSIAGLILTLVLFCSALVLLNWETSPDIRAQSPLTISMVAPQPEPKQSLEPNPIREPASEPTASSPQGTTPLAAPDSQARGASDSQDGGSGFPPDDFENQDAVASYLVERYIERAETDIRVCQNLAEIQDGPIEGVQDFRSALFGHATRLTPENPFIESALIPMGSVLRRPMVSQIVQQIRTAQNTEDLGYLDQADLYATVAMASANLVLDQKDLMWTAQRAYHLYIISRSVALEPGLANDSRTLQLCTEIENRILQNAEPRDPELMTQEKAEILNLLAYSGLTPQMVGFDPNLDNSVVPDVSRSAVSIQVPWMTRHFGANLHIQAEDPRAMRPEPSQTRGPNP